MKYWLCKTEPSTYSIDDLKRDKKIGWEGIRNYQARNYMRDGMSTGDLILIYHSSAEPPGVAGIAKVASEAKADLTAFDKKHDGFDPKSKKDAPTWVCPDVAYVEKFKDLVPLEKLKANAKLKNMLVLKQGNRLSVTPVDEADFQEVLAMAKPSSN